MQLDKGVFDKIKQGEPLTVVIPNENIKTFLFKDPEDPSKGNADIEVIPYCEQSLTQIKEFLEKLYSDLGLE